MKRSTHRLLLLPALALVLALLWLLVPRWSESESESKSELARRIWFALVLHSNWSTTDTFTRNYLLAIAISRKLIELPFPKRMSRRWRIYILYGKLLLLPIKGLQLLARAWTYLWKFQWFGCKVYGTWSYIWLWNLNGTILEIIRKSLHNYNCGNHHMNFIPFQNTIIFFKMLIYLSFS